MTGTPGSDSPSAEATPDGDTRVAWPQPLRLLPLILSCALVVIGALCIVLGVHSLTHAPAVVSAGLLGGAAMVISLSVVSFRESGFRHIRPTRAVRVCEHSEYGAGVHVPMSRKLVPFLIATLAGGAAYGTAAAIGGHLDIGGFLLPAGRDTRDGATAMAIVAVGSISLILLFTLIRIDTALSIYQGGVERYVRRRILFVTKVSRIFLPWDEISAIDVGDLGGNFGSDKHPAIDLHTASVPEPARTPHDNEHRVTLMAHVLPVEPNTLLELLRRLRFEPDRRVLITRPDAVELLRPPPLRDRFRAARAQKRV